jgi:hypothetical protein
MHFEQFFHQTPFLLWMDHKPLESLATSWMLTSGEDTRLLCYKISNLNLFAALVVGT